MLFISNTPDQEEEAKRDFVAEGLEINFVSGSSYLGAYLGPQENLAAWVIPQVEAWDHRVRTLGKIALWHTQLSYAKLDMLLKFEWKYLQITVPGVGTLLGPIEGSLREKLFPVLIWGEEIDTNFRKIIGPSIKHGGLGIPDPWLSADSVYAGHDNSLIEGMDVTLGVAEDGWDWQKFTRAAGDAGDGR